MIETTLYLENISLMEQIQRLENLLAIRKESYELLGYKVEMWRICCESANEDMKNWRRDAGSAGRRGVAF